MAHCRQGNHWPGGREQAEHRRSDWWTAGHMSNNCIQVGHRAGGRPRPGRRMWTGGGLTGCRLGGHRPGSCKWNGGELTGHRLGGHGQPGSIRCEGARHADLHRCAVTVDAGLPSAAALAGG